LEITWYFVVLLLFAGYAVLDGFDLGAGLWGLFTRRGEDRKILLRAIGPVWDGNEVWLLAGAMALFGGFPAVFAGLFSGIYPAAMLIIFALIFRAAAIEFRGYAGRAGREAWDAVFGVASILTALLFGVALGNLVRGLPFDSSGAPAVNTLALLNPYALLVGVTAVAAVSVHGALFLTLKTEGALKGRADFRARRSWVFYFVLLIAVFVWSLLRFPYLLGNFKDYRVLLFVPVAAFGSLVAIRVFLRRAKYAKAFVWSGISIVLILLTGALGVFPRLAPALGDPQGGLTIANAASSERTLTVILIFALVGMPLVLLYTGYAYRTFAGKIEADEAGY